MVHIYYGDGKGKTTAAMGQALRAAGAGWRIVVVQFLKAGTSSEIGLLAALPGVDAVLHDGAQAKFTFRMSEDERAVSRALHDANLARALELTSRQDAAGEVSSHVSGSAGQAPGAAGRLPAGPAQGRLLVLDEALDALAAGLLDEALLERAIVWAAGGQCRELVITGHCLADSLAAKADYLTRFACERHPYQCGVGARLGVEY